MAGFQAGERQFRAFPAWILAFTGRFFLGRGKALRRARGQTNGQGI